MYFEVFREYQHHNIVLFDLFFICMRRIFRKSKGYSFSFIICQKLTMPRRVLSSITHANGRTSTWTYASGGMHLMQIMLFADAAPTQHDMDQ